MMEMYYHRCDLCQRSEAPPKGSDCIDGVTNIRGPLIEYGAINWGPLFSGELCRTCQDEFQIRLFKATKETIEACKKQEYTKR